MTPSTALVPTSAEVVRRESDDWMPVFSIQAAVQRRDAIVDFVRTIMVPNTDFGVIPGTKSKPVLLKPGAERLCSFFGLSPDFITLQEIMDWDGKEHDGEPFFYVKYQCRLSRNGKVIGAGEGSCSSWESKYRYRQGERKCPSCNGAFIIKGKQEYGGGWLCFAKKGGCGAKFPEGDKAIESQSVDRVPNPDIADQVNTIQKMAQKRALVASVLIAVNASEFFTQDLEESQPGWSDSGSQAAADKVASEKLAAAGITDTRVVCSQALREIKKVLSDAFGDDKDARNEWLQWAFGLTVWAKIEQLDADTLLAGLKKITTEIAVRAEKSAHDTEEKLFRSLDKFKRLEAFGKMKERIGEKEYYRILRANGAEKSNQFTSIDAEWSAYMHMSEAAEQDAFDRHMAEPVTIDQVREAKKAVAKDRAQEHTKLVPAHIKKIMAIADNLPKGELVRIMAAFGYTVLGEIPADDEAIIKELQGAADYAKAGAGV